MVARRPWRQEAALVPGQLHPTGGEPGQQRRRPGRGGQCAPRLTAEGQHSNTRR